MRDAPEVTFARGKGRGAKYAAEHQAARRTWRARTTPATPCVRCHQPLGPEHKLTRGRKVGLWHLDHDEHGGYLGFSHATCNTSAGAAKGARITNAKRSGPSRLTW